MNPDDLLARMAVTLRRDIGPNVGDDYARTQAFMAAVVLEKLGRQLALGPQHERANRDDAVALADALTALVERTAVLQTALAGLRAEPGGPSLGRLVEALYRERITLGDDGFATALGLARAALRRRVDRQLEYSA